MALRNRELLARNDDDDMLQDDVKEYYNTVHQLIIQLFQ